MTYKSVLFSLMISLLVLVSISSAQAATIYDLSDPAQRSVNLGTFSRSISGDVIFMTEDEYPAMTAQNVYTSLSGYIPANSTITFTFNSLGFDTSSGRVNASSTYFLEEGRLQGSSSATYHVKDNEVITDTFAGSSIIFGVPSAPVVLISAQVLQDMPSAASLVIQNLSGSVMPFLAEFMQVYAGGSYPRVDVHYEVNAVPLPAALPMFGLGIAAIAGARRRKKKESLS